MGSCISKCKPKMMKQPPLFDFNNNLVQDKLVVIPQPLSPLLTTKTTTTTIPSLSLNNKISPYPPSPSSSISSFTCLSSSTNTSFSTASSSPSPISSHHPFPSPYNQLLRINSLKATAFPPPIKPVSPLVRHPSPQRVLRSTPQKRVRPASPSPIRQKSFRKEVLPQPLPSPSPSRRFSREKCRVAVAPKSRSPARSSVMKKEITCIHRISSKIDEVAVKEAVGDLDSVVAMEDIDNPLISLDCFIFL
ncbi:proline-rich receptor-like protein kinase PERK2 [Benincasa hispida]|uniref:proline-rich receptor-like protein kinase PERK2 n=1 Tax=Benincasa hispida TaxID=102211 RepID=UPI0019004531|nr:proline-rich receptor-like protein kinase PERK2 [Benincasa hispida]